MELWTLTLETNYGTSSLSFFAFILVASNTWTYDDWSVLDDDLKGISWVWCASRQWDHHTARMDRHCSSLLHCSSTWLRRFHLISTISMFQRLKMCDRCLTTGSLRCTTYSDYRIAQHSCALHILHAILWPLIRCADLWSEVGVFLEDFKSAFTYPFSSVLVRPLVVPSSGSRSTRSFVRPQLHERSTRLIKSPIVSILVCKSSNSLQTRVKYSSL